MSGRTATPTPLRRRLLWQALAGVALAVVLLVVLFTQINLPRFADAFKRMDVALLAAALVLRVCAVALRSARWHGLGVTHPRATLTDCFSATVNGFLVGLAVPGLCEFTRAYIVKRRAEVPFGAVLSVLVVERVFDALFLLVVVFLTLVFQPAARGLIIPAVVIGILLAAGTGLLALFVAARAWSVRVIDLTVGRLWPRAGERVAGFVGTLADGFRQLARLPVSRIGAVFGLTAAFWLAHACFVYLVFQGLGGDLALAFYVALFTAAVEYFGMIVSLTPMGLGQYQVLVVGVLAIFGVDASQATSASVVLQGVRLLATLLLGLPFMAREHVGLARLAMAKAAREATGGSDSGEGTA